MLSWSRDYVLDKVYEDMLRLRLLEEVDADSVGYSLASLEGPSLLLPSAILAGGSTVVTALFRSGFSVAATVTGAGLVSSFLANAFFLRCLRSLPNGLSSCLLSAKSLFAELKRREQIRFGLGLAVAQPQLKLQCSVILAVRRLVHCLRQASSELARNLSDDESSHLLSNFYTSEMKALIDDPIEEGSYLNTGGAISTLLDLAVLHISEVSRLYLLCLSQLTYRNTPSLWRFAHSLNKNFESLKFDFKVLSKATHSRSERSVTPQQSQTGKVLSAEEKMAVALDNIASGLWSNTMSVEDARSALQKVLAMEGLKPSKNEPQPVIPTVEPEKEQKLDERVPRVPEPVVDQVFEGFVDEKDLYPTSDDWQLDPLGNRENHTSLMGELRLALGDRSRDFELRERKALAAFYGVSEEEIAQREEKECAAEEEKEKGEKHLEAVGEGTEDADRPAFERRVAPLPSDLLKALSMRPRAAETALGDSSESDDDE